jgi:hypothetical protein
MFDQFREKIAAVNLYPSCDIRRSCAIVEVYDCLCDTYHMKYIMCHNGLSNAVSANILSNLKQVIEKVKEILLKNKTDAGIRIILTGYDYIVAASKRLVECAVKHEHSSFTDPVFTYEFTDALKSLESLSIESAAMMSQNKNNDSFGSHIVDGKRRSSRILIKTDIMS